MNKMNESSVSSARIIYPLNQLPKLLWLILSIKQQDQFICLEQIQRIPDDTTAKRIKTVCQGLGLPKPCKFGRVLSVLSEISRKLFAIIHIFLRDVSRLRDEWVLMSEFILYNIVTVGTFFGIAGLCLKIFNKGRLT